MEELITLTLNALLLFGIWWLYFVEYKKYRLDKARQELFSIRDELFQSWSSSERSFDEPAYGMMRTTLNGMTRFAHKLSATRLVAAVIADEIFAKGLKAKEFEVEFNASLSRLPSQERGYIKHARAKMHEVILKHIVFSSLILTFAFIVTFMIFATNSIIRSVIKKTKVKEGLSMIDAEAERIGHHHLMAQI